MMLAACCSTVLCCAALCCAEVARVSEDDAGAGVPDQPDDAAQVSGVVGDQADLLLRVRVAAVGPGAPGPPVHRVRRQGARQVQGPAQRRLPPARRREVGQGELVVGQHERSRRVAHRRHLPEHQAAHGAPPARPARHLRPHLPGLRCAAPRRASPLISSGRHVPVGARLTRARPVRSRTSLYCSLCECSRCAGVPKAEHERFMAATQQSIIDGSSKWSAKVAITVICAQVRRSTRCARFAATVLYLSLSTDRRA